jgi:hypothetical protein
MKLSFNLTQLLTAAFFFTLLTIGSCSKENSQGTNAQEEDASLASSESDAEAEMVFNEVFDDAMGPNNDVGMAGTGVFGRGTTTDGLARLDSLPGCATVTITHPAYPAFFPVKIVVDFGTTGCSSTVDGHVRKGKIITEYTNRLIIPGAVATTTFDGFYIDDIKVEGTHKITNTSPLITTTPPPSREFTVDVINAKLSMSNGNYTEWNSHKTIKQTAGLSTPDYPRDDVFEISGSAHGRAQRGNLLVIWESNVLEPLIKRFDCRWIVQGKVKTVRVTNNTSSPWVAIFDFGYPNNGNCDNKATVTINGGTPHIITLH